MSTSTARLNARLHAWLERWGPLLPLLAAELTVMIGFGALLPILPLFAEEQGIDATTLGLVIAAWPTAKLIFEPVFGRWADRHPRKPQMVAGLALLGVLSVLPLVFASAAGLIVLRFLGGVAAAMYDPAARGMIVDATEENERGEAFGIYSAFQIGGFIFGPAIGALGAAFLGGYAFPFILTGVLSLAAAAVLALRLESGPHVVEDERFEHHPEAQPLPGASPFATPVATPVVVGTTSGSPRPEAQAPLSALWNRTLIGAFVLSFGLHLSIGVYEVVWSLYLVALGASVVWVGFTFVFFGLPQMIASPIAGRLVDRKGPVRFVVASGLVIMAAGSAYAWAREPILPTLVVPIEAIATAAFMPAIFSMVASGTPPGRASAAQGLLGSTATIAVVIASLLAGVLFDTGDVGLPFVFFVAGMGVCLVVGLVIYRGGARTPVKAEVAGSLESAA
jgi:DHA1 family multidrug resistance protein-like MFS transporter